MGIVIYHIMSGISEFCLFCLIFFDCAAWCFRGMNMYGIGGVCIFFWVVRGEWDWIDWIELIEVE